MLTRPNHVQESIGNLTGSKEWQTVGKDLQATSKEDMHAASNISMDPTQRTATTSLGNEGSLEKTIGFAIGCPGMEEQGGFKQTQANS